MKNYILYALCALSIVTMATACGGDLDIKQDYAFTVEHLPVPKRLKVGETAEIRCQILTEGNWQDAAFQLRYFQPDGRGQLRDEAGTVFLPNDLYDVENQTFRLYYTSLSEDTQTVDIYFLDNFRNMFTLTFSFNNDNKETEEQ